MKECSTTNFNHLNKKKSSSSKTSAIAYTDGSFDSKNKTYSYGVIIIWGNKLIKMSLRYHKDENSRYQNVAGELMGAIRVVKFALSNKIKKITIHYDYKGIACWASGEWQAKNGLTKKYQKFIQEAIVKISIDFKWVKGHSGDYYNGMVDSLATSASFSEYRNVEEV